MHALAQLCVPQLISHDPQAARIVAGGAPSCISHARATR